MINSLYFGTISYLGRIYTICNWIMTKCVHYTKSMSKELWLYVWLYNIICAQFEWTIVNVCICICLLRITCWIYQLITYQLVRSQLSNHPKIVHNHSPICNPFFGSHSNILLVLSQNKKPSFSSFQIKLDVTNMLLTDDHVCPHFFQIGLYNNNNNICV